MKQFYNVPVFLLLTSCFIVFVTPLSIPASSEVIAVETKHVLEKDNLLLVCNTTEQPDLEDFYWIKNVTARETSTFYQFGWKLEFITILRGSSGIYSCHATNNKTGENVTLVAFNVDVQYPGEVTHMNIWPRNITANETFSVDCGFHGNPEPTWSIMKENSGRRVMSATASADVSLWGNHVWCGDSGMWVCTGGNILNKGINATRGYYLTVRCSPQPDPDVLHVYDYKASLGSTVAMALDVVGDPDTTYKWSRSDNKMFGDIVVEESSRRAILKIFNIGPEDFGYYTLDMANSMGSYQAHFQLKAYGYPGKPFDFRVSSITYNSVNLSWTSGYDSGTTQRFQIMKMSDYKYKSISPMIYGSYENGGFGRKWNYHLTGLEGDTRYMLSVKAQNLENTTFSEPLIFFTAPPPLPPVSQSSSSNIIAFSIGFVVMAATVLVLILALRLHRRRRAQFHLEDKKLAAKNMMAQYGGTFSVNGELKK